MPALPRESARPNPPDPAGPAPARAMGQMFDDVSPRYDLLNRLMTLGLDTAWRAAMWRLVPRRARVVLDLCTGNGVSLRGLLAPGRLVLGMDASAGMLAHAAASYPPFGWGPRLACADAFRLPLRDGAVDAITVAFGVRNLRPRPAALAGMARVLAPGGTLVVLEATAPADGPLAPLHRAWIRNVIPALGGLSSDPAAYRYLSESIFAFGAGPEFERDLAQAGFDIVSRQSFALGAARLWAARRGTPAGEFGAARDGMLHDARPAAARAGEMPHAAVRAEGEWRAWVGVQLVTALALTVALVYGIITYHNYRVRLPLEHWQQTALEVLLVGGAILFGIRTAVLVLRLMGPPPRM